MSFLNHLLIVAQLIDWRLRGLAAPKILSGIKPLWWCYTRSCLAYRNVPAGWKNVGNREDQICVRKLAANAGD
jgi:hypothetical protein